MHIQAKDLIALMNQWAPPTLAEKWDHPGLQVGNSQVPVQKVLVTLDLTEENVDLAIEKGASMIISHHPFLFKAIHELDLSSYTGRVIEKLIKHDILAFAAHTNLDTARGGVNDALAAALELSHTTGLVPEAEEKMVKLASYVTPTEAKSFYHHVKEAYPGQAGHYYLLDDEDDATREAKMEMNVLSSALPSLLADLKERCGDVHYDIYPLANGAQKEYMGRIGELPHTMNGKEALAYIKEKLCIPDLRYAGNPDITVNKVAVLGGAGSEFAKLAKAKGADLYLTGDLKYHEAQDASRLGLLIADGGHFYTERVIVPYLAERLRKAAQEKSWDLEVLEDSGAEDIFSHI